MYRRNRREEGVKQFFQEFDNVYVINRAKDIERRENIVEQLKPFCPTYTLFEATDGWQESLPFIETKENVLYEGWTRGASGLVDTTIRLLEEALERNYEQILIMEDDIIFNGLLYKVYDLFRTLPKDWELFHLACKDYKKSKRQGKLKQLSGSWSCQIYAVHRRVFEEYLKVLKERDKPIDLVTSEYLHPRGHSYSPRYNMINTVPNMSSIRDKFVHYT